MIPDVVTKMQDAYAGQRFVSASRYSNAADCCDSGVVKTHIKRFMQEYWAQRGDFEEWDMSVEKPFTRLHFNSSARFIALEDFQFFQREKELRIEQEERQRRGWQETQKRLHDLHAAEQEAPMMLDGLEFYPMPNPPRSL